MWVLDIYASDKWLLSTKELAEKAIKLFKLKPHDYDLREQDVTDDKALLARIATLQKEEQEKLNL